MNYYSPVCRYELETEDSLYELSRKSRMKERKQRYRLDELNKKSISALKEMMSLFNISVVGCIDKRDLIDRLLASDKIEIVEGAPVVELTSSELYGKNIHELQELLLAYGISAEGALEKKELVDRLINSGRIVVVASESDQEILLGDSCSSESYFDHTSTSVRDAAGTDSRTSGGDESSCSHSVFEYKNDSNGIYAGEANASKSHIEGSLTGVGSDRESVRDVLYNKGVKELCKLLRSVGISTDGAIEKEELIKRFIDSGRKIPQHYQNVSTTSVSSAEYVKSHTEAATVEPLEKVPVKKQRLVDADSQYCHSSEVPATSASSGDDYMRSMSVKELKEICNALGLDFTGCLDKTDIYDKLKTSGYFQSS